MCEALAPHEEGLGREGGCTDTLLLCRVAKLKTVASVSRALQEVTPCVQHWTRLCCKKPFLGTQRQPALSYGKQQ